MVNNSDWGAATYLSASKYGAGYNGVQINANGAGHSGSYGTTGCGPRANGDTSSYGGNNIYSALSHTDEVGGALGTQSACYSGDIQRAYNGTLGQLASTTNNPTGIYDMVGGGYEYVAASYTTNLNESGVSDKYGDYFGTKAHPPYVNTYNITNLNSCTFNTCGGHALYEAAQWNGNYMGFVSSSDPWFGRGSRYDGGSSAGLFDAGEGVGFGFIDGYGGCFNAFRVALAPAP